MWVKQSGQTHTWPSATFDLDRYFGLGQSGAVPSEPEPLVWGATAAIGRIATTARSGSSFNEGRLQ